LFKVECDKRQVKVVKEEVKRKRSKWRKSEGEEQSVSY
jgi:hypothetical protein